MTPTSIKFPTDMRQTGERVAKSYGLSFNALIRMLLAKEIRRAKALRRVRVAA
jgi:antitoxin component of RelBE/YafQ-DinJ toxin-antitoxin module